MMVDLETATIRLYEEANLTDDLVDQDATTLLKWAEEQVAELVAKYGSDEAAFESAFSALRSLVKNMNRYVGQREMSDEAQQSQRLENITQSATEIGFEMTPTFGTQSLSRSAQTNSQLLQTMLNSLQKTDTPLTAQTADDTESRTQASGITADHSRHTRRMTLQSSSGNTSEPSQAEPQEITEDRIVNVFTVHHQDMDDSATVSTETENSQDETQEGSTPD
jgi:hypothetical protein